MMQIRKATSRDLECIRELTRETIGQIYPVSYTHLTLPTKA
mgnify:CR=1 FL=1